MTQPNKWSYISGTGRQVLDHMRRNGLRTITSAEAAQALGLPLKKAQNALSEQARVQGTLRVVGTIKDRARRKPLNVYELTNVPPGAHRSQLDFKSGASLQQVWR